MISSSLFDDEDANNHNKGFWKTEKKAIRIKESKFTSNPKKYFRGTLFKKEKKPGEYKALVFILIGNRLSYIKVNLCIWKIKASSLSLFSLFLLLIER